MVNIVLSIFNFCVKFGSFSSRFAFICSWISLVPSEDRLKRLLPCLYMEFKSDVMHFCPHIVWYYGI